jgi:hypothetical protein
MTKYIGNNPVLPLDLSTSNITNASDFTGLDLTTVLDALKVTTDGHTSDISGKANTSHTHNADDINAGTLATARIPSLAASKITSGTFNADRIPTLAQSKITDLETNLGNKLELSNVTGKHTIWLPAGAWALGEANPVPEVSVPNVASAFETPVLAFDPTVTEYSWATVKMPKSWDGAPFEYRVIWTATSGSGGVEWWLGGRSFADDDPVTAREADATSTDTLIAANDIHMSPWATPTLASGDSDELLMLLLYRYPIGVADTLATDALMLGVEIRYTTNAATDD